MGSKMSALEYYLLRKHPFGGYTVLVAQREENCLEVESGYPEAPIGSERYFEFKEAFAQAFSNDKQLEVVIHPECNTEIASLRSMEYYELEEEYFPEIGSDGFINYDEDGDFEVIWALGDDQDCETCGHSFNRIVLEIESNLPSGEVHWALYSVLGCSGGERIDSWQIEAKQSAELLLKSMIGFEEFDQHSFIEAKKLLEACDKTVRFINCN